MFEFDELEAALPPEVYVVSGAGYAELNGIYQQTDCEHNGAAIFRHSTVATQLMSREKVDSCHGWCLGVSGKILYGVRTEDADCSNKGWRTFQGDKPVPAVEGFSALVDGMARYGELLCQEAERLANEGKFRNAADVYKRAGSLNMLPSSKKVEIHANRAKVFRQLAESKKTVRQEGEKGTGVSLEADPLHGLAAEWAIEEAEKALELDEKCFLAAWEGAIAAKSISWWSKGRILAKKAMDSVPGGAAHRSQRETASTLFLLMAEEEQTEKQRKLQEMEASRKAPDEEPLDAQELDFALEVINQLNDALKVESFRRPHHQLWKLVGPGLLKKDADDLFEQIRQLVWSKWNPIAWSNGYRTNWDKSSRKTMCARIVDVANHTKGADVLKIVREIEDRVCLEWGEIPEPIDRPNYDESWNYHRREDGTWGTYSGPTTV